MTEHPQWYLDDYTAYMEAAGDDNERVVLFHALDERTPTTMVDVYNLHQDVWAFRRVLIQQPASLLDVGSNATLLALLAQFLPVTTVDVRPLEVEVKGLTPMRGDVTALPFEDNSQAAVMCLSVIEHIGLGRYGDPIDPHGSERACKELQRVLAPGGHLYLSVPVTDEPVTLFNRERHLSPLQISEWLDQCDMGDGVLLRGDGLDVWCVEWIKHD